MLPLYAPKLDASQRAVLESLAGKSWAHRRRVLRESFKKLGWLGPRFLYKYFASRRDVPFDEKKLRDVLVESEVFLSSPDGFNDPFDFRARAVLSDFETAKSYLFSRIDRTEKGRENRARARAAAIRNLSDPMFVEQTFSRVRGQQGVCCFSDNPRSIPMWGHYADSHAGVCVQWSPANDAGALGFSLKVKYSPDFPVLHYSAEIEDVVDKVIVRKFDEWKYESEFRIVVPNAPNHRMKFAPSAVTAIILGARASEPGLSIVRRVLAERASRGLPELAVHHCAMDPRSYGMILRRGAL